MSEENKKEIDKYSIVRLELINVTNNAQSLTLVQNAGAAFEAVVIVKKLRDILTNQLMEEVYMPLMNSKIGFLTDKPTKSNPTEKYSIEIVRDCLIDAIGFGLLPTFNQFNIIAGKMYPTKEGYAAKLKQYGVKYFLSFGLDKGATAGFAEIPVKINYSIGEEKSDFSIVAVVKKDTYSSYDQLKGKAERRAKKALYEYVTGLDLGEDDGSGTDDKDFETINSKVTTQPKDLFDGSK